MRTALLMVAAAAGMAVERSHAYTGLCDPGQPNSKQIWCNSTLPVDERVAALVAAIPLSEKPGMLGNTGKGSKTLDIPGYEWWSEALHGVANSPGVHFQGSTPFATSFPQVCTTAASFNETLFHAIGSAISTEARGMHNQGNAGLTFWAPNINIFRDPRWGRGQETPGEDPYWNGRYAYNFVTGMQEGEDPRYIKASACLKHWDAYSEETWGGVTRFEFDAIIPLQDLYDTYMPAFQAGAAEGHASSVMCSYNAVNGIPSCANSVFNNDVLRDAWGFDGYLTSDCGAINVIESQHHYTSTWNQTVKVATEAGVDLDCGSVYSRYYQDAIDAGSVTEAQLDGLLTDLFTVRMKLGQFDPTAIQPYAQIPPSDVNSAPHAALALEAAQQGIVMLKNSGSVLPLTPSSSLTVALIGPNANDSHVQLGNYFGDPESISTPLDGLQSYGAHVTYVQGAGVAGTSTAGFSAAQAAAGAADVTIIVGGLNQTQEAEMHDRNIIWWPGVQAELISDVCAAAKGPCILVSMSGGPIDFTAQKDSADVDAILWAGYPGQAGGQALADILFGAVNPSGRLSTTIYPSSYITTAGPNVSMWDMHMRPNTTTGYPGRSYRFYTGDAVYPFGYGLSYTTFTYTWASPAMQHASAAAVAEHLADHAHVFGGVFAPSSRGGSPELGSFEVTVTNSGKTAGADSVLCFLSPPDAGQDGQPLKYLMGAKRVFLQPGESTTLFFPVTAADVSRVDEVEGVQGGAVRVVVKGDYTMQVGVEEAGASTPAVLRVA